MKFKLHRAGAYWQDDDGFLYEFHDEAEPYFLKVSTFEIFLVVTVISDDLVEVS